MKQLIKTFLIAAFLMLIAALMTSTFLTSGDSTAVYAIGSMDGYDLKRPEVRLELPEILHEVSGITDLDENRVACIQDEDGLIFIYDLKKKEIKKQIKFGEAGDYEGITRVGDTLYVLRSDGRLFEVRDFMNAAFQVKEYDTNIPIKNNEGLGYEAKNNRLLIAGKSKPHGDKYKGTKAVFAFDLSTKTISEQAVYEFSAAKIKQFVLDNDKDNNKKKFDSKGKSKIKIYPSAIAVHPLTNKLYVLSSKNNLIYIFDKKGDIETVQSLDEKMFTQAEGIAFFDNGEMIISNEGKDAKPTLLRFPYGGK